MAEPLKKLSPGDGKLSASTWNQMVDATKASILSKLSSNFEVTPRGLSDTRILIKNGHEAHTLEAFVPVTITAAENVIGGDRERSGFMFAHEADKRGTLITCQSPNAGFITVANCRGMVAVPTEPIPPGRTGQAVISGVVHCWIRKWETGHKYADFGLDAPETSTDVYLRSANEGCAYILYNFDSINVAGASNPGDFCLIRLSNRHDPTAGCQIEIGEDGEINWVAEDAAGDGLQTSDDECKKLEVKPDCGITVSASGVKVDNSAIAGNGLQAGTGCVVEVKPDCGITVSGDGVGVDNTALAGSGLAPEGTCALAVAIATAGPIIIDPDPEDGGLTIDVDCGLKIEDGKLGTDRSDLIGDGLHAGGGSCDLAVKESCHINVDSNGVSVDEQSLVGASEADGLEVVTADGCDHIGVKPGCGIIVDAAGVSVDLNSLVGPDPGSGLFVAAVPMEGACEYLAVKTGDGITISETGEVKASIGCGLYFVDGRIEFDALLVASPDGALGIDTGVSSCTMKVNVDNTTIAINGSNQLTIKETAEWAEIPYVESIDYTDPCDPVAVVKILRLKIPSSLWEVVDP